MPRYNVEADEEWACFSSVTESFLTPFMPIEEYEKWRDEEYGRTKMPLDIANKMSLREAIHSLSFHSSDKEILLNLRQAGVMYTPDEDAERGGT